MRKNIISFDSLQSFNFSIHHVPHILPQEISGSHIHDQCEIYVNVTGKVSFMVEGQLYPIHHGDVIITRPFEYHHCVYREITPHEHYWILFSCENRNLLDLFFNRPLGTGNHIVPHRPEQLLTLCQKLTEKHSTLEQYTNFFHLLQLLQEGSTPGEKALPQELQNTLETLNQDFTSPLSIKTLAQKQFVSINTLERQFKSHLGITPIEYLRQKRLACAARLLQQGASVSQAASESGFSDVSQFIAIFKKYFSCTPLQYKKERK